MYQKGNYELRILFESELYSACEESCILCRILHDPIHLSAHLELAHSQCQKVVDGTSSTPERIHIMYWTSTYKIGDGWEVSLIPIHVI